MKSLATLFGLLLFVSSAEGAEQALSMHHLTYVEESERVRVDILGEGAFFKSDSVDLSGGGISFGGRFALEKRWALGVELAQALTLESGSVAALYTGIRGRLHFALSGNFEPSHRRLQLEGQTLALAVEARRPIWALQVGVDQYLFNGTNTVTPATGVGFGLSYDAEFWDTTWTARLGSGFLVLNQNIIIPLTLSLGTSIGF